MMTLMTIMMMMVMITMVRISPSVTQKNEGGLVAYIFADVCIGGGTYPPNPNRKTSPCCIGASEDYGKMAMTRVFAAQGGEFHEDVLSYLPKMYETYGGETS